MLGSELWYFYRDLGDVRFYKSAGSYLSNMLRFVMLFSASCFEDEFVYDVYLMWCHCFKGEYGMPRMYTVSVL